MLVVVAVSMRTCWDLVGTISSVTGGGGAETARPRFPHTALRFKCVSRWRKKQLLHLGHRDRLEPCSCRGCSLSLSKTVQIRAADPVWPCFDVSKVLTLFTMYGNAIWEQYMSVHRVSGYFFCKSKLAPSNRAEKALNNHSKYQVWTCFDT